MPPKSSFFDVALPLPPKKKLNERFVVWRLEQNQQELKEKLMLHSPTRFTVRGSDRQGNPRKEPIVTYSV